VTPTLHVCDLGRRRYGEVLALQRALAAQRLSGELADDLLLLVEHEPVVTLGRSTEASSLPLDPDAIARRGTEVFEVERGGDVTWHGPGQLVGYPILDLRAHREDLHWYLRTLEDVLIDALESLGIPADRHPGRTGVWTAGRKIASIGVHAKRWVTYHGFALNVTNTLEGFELIVPCGLHGVVMTSVQVERGGDEDPISLGVLVRARVTTTFARAFARLPHALTAEALEARIP
jgi:lipoyl(octanoyl) transferase